MKTIGKDFLFTVFVCLMAGPLSADIVINGPMTYEKTAAPGETYEGVIELQNTEAGPQELKVYQTDYLFYADGRVLYGDPGKTPRSNAAWIDVSPKRAVIPPKDKLSLRYLVKVPADAALVGTYWSMIMIEGIGSGSPESATGPGKTAMGVRQVFRYGVQMVTHIGDSGTRSLKFLSSKLFRQKGRLLFQLEAENTGERWLRSVMWVELYDLKGAFVGKFEGGRLRLYPGTSVRYTADLTSVPNGTYKALAVIDCGGKDIFGANFNLVLK